MLNYNQISIDSDNKGKVEEEEDDETNRFNNLILHPNEIINYILQINFGAHFSAIRILNNICLIIMR